ncbi:MAG: hypothetical protein KKD25_00670 [Gammaproteobacteria bacterium]|jgi:hypothetical protein|nr:hypothetical protein [Gammaproteobacteria bacterium]MBU0773546.1 hypothetical protein [Gammaproteobacteria bacterium]MBU0857690.1 hypothetical protein [Gammaproteobacteria bacterium]MBU1848106.1 hypothetical protein [Gammaproteobacteria bacterium]
MVHRDAVRGARAIAQEGGAVTVRHIGHICPALVARLSGVDDTGVPPERLVVVKSLKKKD